MYRLIIYLALFLLIMYYAMLALHLLGLLKMTKADIKAKKLLIPFFYFIKN